MPLLAFVPDPETSVTPGPEGTRGIPEELVFPQQETKYTETQALPSLNPQGESVNSPKAGAHHVLSGNGGGAPGNNNRCHLLAKIPVCPL